MRIKKGEIKSFNSGNYTAVVRISGSYKVYLQDITVARNIAPAEMITGRKVVVLLFDEYSPKEAVVMAVYS